MEQSLGGHSVGTGQTGQVTVGQEVGGGVVGQVGQVTRGGHVGQMVGGAQVGHGSRVGHVPQQLLQVGQEGVDGVLGSIEARGKQETQRERYTQIKYIFLVERCIF